MAQANDISEFTSFNAINNAGNSSLGEQSVTDREHYLSGAPSKAAIQGHPVHPILVTMPIALLFTAFITDWVNAFSHDRFWARVTRWLLGCGVVTGVAAAAIGFVDFALIGRVRAVKAGWIHMIGNVIVLTLSWINWRMRPQHNSRVSMIGRGLSTVVAVLLGITGWFGGQLIYRYKVAVNNEKSEIEHRA